MARGQKNIADEAKLYSPTRSTFEALVAARENGEMGGASALNTLGTFAVFARRRKLAGTWYA